MLTAAAADDKDLALLFRHEESAGPEADPLAKL
jgi:hypothetical protein